MRLMFLFLASMLVGCASAPAGRERSLAAATVCDACARPTGPERGGVRWRDGRASCSTCRETAVHTRPVAREALVESAALLKRTLKLTVDPERVSLRLVARPALMKQAGDLAHPNLRGFTEITEKLRNDVVTERAYRVYILWGLPRRALVGILAHELFHVWQTSEGGTRPNAEAVFREGAANFAQLRVLLELGAQRWARQLKDDPDPVYGAGLRRFSRLVEVEGERKALELAAQRDGFPAGY